MPPIIPQRELQDGISEEEVCAPRVKPKRWSSHSRARQVLLLGSAAKAREERMENGSTEAEIERMVAEAEEVHARRHAARRRSDVAQPVARGGTHRRDYLARIAGRRAEKQRNGCAVVPRTSQEHYWSRLHKVM